MTLILFAALNLLCWIFHICDGETLSMYNLRAIELMENILEKQYEMKLINLKSVFQWAYLHGSHGNQLNAVLRTMVHDTFKI